MFDKSADLYDLIYSSFKDYADEASKVRSLIHLFATSGGNALLDVACGTGEHLVHLRDGFNVQGLDLDEGLLEVVRGKLPDVPLHHADMAAFDLGQQFDAVTCLFSAISYLPDVATLNKAIAAMTRHLKPGGVLIIEPFIAREKIRTPHVGAVFIEQEFLKVARFSRITVDGFMADIEFAYMVGTPEGVTHFVEHHITALFTHDEYMAAFEGAGLKTTHDPEGIFGRGLYIGVKLDEEPA